MLSSVGVPGIILILTVLGIMLGAIWFVVRLLSKKNS